MDLDVKQDPSKRMYVAHLDGGEAVLAYEEAGPGVLDFQHTEVPEALQGQGVGEELVRRALDDARKRGYKVIPSCPFVHAFIRRHEEYSDLVES